MLITAGKDIYELTIANCEGHLEAVKAVDDLAFGSHHGITMNELEMIMCGGGFVAMFSLHGQIVAESQVVTRQIDQLKWTLQRNSAFCYGIGVHPEYQGRGFGRELLKEQEEFARQNGHDQMYTTIRVENYPSIKAFLAIGHQIVDYIPFYGDSTNCYRLLLRRSLVVPPPQANDEDAKIVPVKFGDEIDTDAHRSVADLLHAGYVGTTISRDGITFSPFS